MFKKVVRWLLGWFGRREKLDEFRPARRIIYSYFDGQKTVKADPMRIYRRLAEAGPEIGAGLLSFESALTGKQAFDAHGNAVLKLRTVFDLPAFEDGGLTDLETMALFDHFLTFVGHQGKAAGNGRTAQKPPAAPPPVPTPTEVPQAAQPVPPPIPPPIPTGERDAPVVTINLDEEGLALLRQGAANLPPLHGADGAEGGPAAPAPAADGRGTGA